jgi:hypothetical protein
MTQEKKVDFTMLINHIIQLQNSVEPYHEGQVGTRLQVTLLARTAPSL